MKKIFIALCIIFLCNSAFASDELVLVDTFARFIQGQELPGGDELVIHDRFISVISAYLKAKDLLNDGDYKGCLKVLCDSNLISWDFEYFDFDSFWRHFCLDADSKIPWNSLFFPEFFPEEYPKDYEKLFYNLGSSEQAKNLAIDIVFDFNTRLRLLFINYLF